MKLYYFSTIYRIKDIDKASSSIYTVVWSKGMCLMGKFNFIPNCSAIQPVLSSGYQTFAISDMFNVGHSKIIPISGIFWLAFSYLFTERQFPSKIFKIEEKIV